MNLEDLYNEVKFGIRTWNDEKLLRNFLPQMASAISGRTQAGIQAGSAIGTAGIRAGASKDVARIGEVGATQRTKLTNAANILMRRLMEGGATSRLQMGGEQDMDKLRTTDRNQTRMLRDFGEIIGTGRRSYGYSAEDINSLIDEKLSINTLSKKKDEEEEYNDTTEPIPSYQLPY